MSADYQFMSRFAMAIQLHILVCGTSQVFFYTESIQTQSPYIVKRDKRHTFKLHNWATVIVYTIWAHSVDITDSYLVLELPNLFVSLNHSYFSRYEFILPVCKMCILVHFFTVCYKSFLPSSGFVCYPTVDTYNVLSCHILSASRHTISLPW